jgi:biotin carboxyl carrier protein
VGVSQLADELGLYEIFVKEGKDYIKIVKEEKRIEESQGPEIEVHHHHKIISPLTGTFYRRPRPEEPPYCEIGSEIEKGDTLALIEAMKVFNEIKSDIAGRIVDILPKNGQSVKERDVLFLIEPTH